MTHVDLAGEKFGRLTVLRRAVRDVDFSFAGRYTYRWVVACECGKEKIVEQQSLCGGRTTSCGCYAKERAVATAPLRRRRSMRTVDHPLYRTWSGVKTRCFNKNVEQYASYGGRGITIYAPWSEDFWEFADWLDENLGPRPEGHSLDRVNNNGNYEPGNLRWASSAEQGNNRRWSVSNETHDIALARIALLEAELRRHAIMVPD